MFVSDKSWRISPVAMLRPSTGSTMQNIRPSHDGNGDSRQQMEQRLSMLGAVVVFGLIHPVSIAFIIGTLVSYMIRDDSGVFSIQATLIGALLTVLLAFLYHCYWILPVVEAIVDVGRDLNE
jgi:hypothetical protein